MFKDNAIEPSSSFDINEFLANAMMSANHDENEPIDNDGNENNTVLEETNLEDINLEESDLDMLRQVQDIDKRFNCRICEKKFSRKTYQLYHEQHCDENKQQSSTKRIRQSKIDDFIPNIATLQEGGAIQESDEPQLIQSTVNKVAVTYRKWFDRDNRVDYFERLKNALTSYHDTIIVQKNAKKSIKYYFTVVLIFHKNKNTEELTDPPISFRSAVFTLLDGNIDEAYNHSLSAYQQFVKQIEEFQRNGSDWVLNHFICLDLGIYSSFYAENLHYCVFNVLNFVV